MMNRGDRYREGKARWALPYVWPVDGDIDTMIDRDVRLGTLVTRALIDGSLCASSSVPGTAESAIILYECPRGMERSLRPATATEAVMKITGIPKERILTLSVSPESNHDLVNEGVSVAVLLVAEIPQFVEQWLEHFTHEKGFRNTLKDTVEKTWSSPGNDAREESSDDVDVPIADYQTRAWDEVKNAMLDFRNQPGIDKAAATFSETKLEDDLADLSKRIAATDIWAEFDSFADRAGIYDYLPRPSTDDSVSS
jgi:hypothetical protein